MRTLIKDLKDGQEVVLKGWVKHVRVLKTVAFIKLEDMTGSVQVVVKDEALLREVKRVGKEWVLEVKGNVVGGEVRAREITVLNEVLEKLPVDPSNPVADLPTRLRYRFLDLRRKDVRHVFELKSVMVNAFRQFLLKKDFVEIHPPVIIGTASEGGAELFPLQYFEKQAFLAQSPQLYKQLAVIGGLERVFSTMPVFRAEKHNTTTHLNEITMLDVEVAFIEFDELMNMARDVLLFMINEAANYHGEGGVTTATTISFAEAKELLSSDPSQDFTREEEQALCKELGDVVVVHSFPAHLRAFYTFPRSDGTSLSFDIIYKGLEVTSGAQRIHLYNLLKQEIERRGLDIKTFEFYLEAFKFGAPPHGGFGMGLERVLMSFLNLHNIREATLYPRDRERLIP
jgi:aspartyl-tRNA synthetase